MSEFQYFHFPILPVKEVVEQLPEMDNGFLLKAYTEWFETFYSKASFFYKIQWMNHCEQVNTQFRRTHGLTEDDSIEEYDLEDEWDGAAEDAGLPKHEHARGNADVELHRLMKHLMPNRQIVVSFKELAQDMLEILAASAEGRLHPAHLRTTLDALWFNTCITNNDAVKAVELHDMPYADYLKTKHWRRVRAAMLLIHRARCQGNNCYGADDGHWLGDEYLIHVHHMTYKHRGCERFEELRLVCGLCHKKLHDGHELEVFPEPERVWTTL